MQQVMTLFTNKFSASIFIILGIVLSSCTHDEKPSNNMKAGNEETQKNEVNIATADTGIVLESLRYTTTISNKLFEFLEKPLDLQVFKKAYGPSNGGSMSGKIFHKPDTIGSFYRYMLFNNLRQIKLNNRLISEGESFGLFQVYVYRYGETIGDFYDSDEELVGLRCAFSDERLGNANLVGKALTETETLFGHTFVDLDSIRIYSSGTRALSLCFDSGQVEWYKLYYLSSDINQDSIPDCLIKFYYE